MEFIPTDKLFQIRGEDQNYQRYEGDYFDNLTFQFNQKYEDEN